MSGGYKIKGIPKGFRVAVNGGFAKPARRLEAHLTPQQKIDIEKFLLANPNANVKTVAAKLGLTKSLVDGHLASAGRPIAQEIALGHLDASNPMVK